MDDNFADVYPVGKSIEYMQSVLALRPRTLLPLTSLEEDRMLASLPDSTIPLIGHPLAQDGDHGAIDPHQNPFVHRFRRKLILRQKRRNNPFIHQGFNLDQNVRDTLRKWDADDTRLLKLHPARTVGNHLNSIAEKRTVPLHLQSKLRRTDHIVVDEPRIERRRQLALERFPDLVQTQLKLQQVQQRAQVMQAWIAHEDDLAMRNLAAIAAENSEIGGIGPVATQAMEIGSEPAGHLPITFPDVESHTMEGIMDATTAVEASVSKSGAQSKVSSLLSVGGRDGMPGSSILPSRSSQTHGSMEALDREKGAVVERYSFAKASQGRAGPASAAMRSEVRLQQLHDLEKRSTSLGPQHIFTSADMERYLAQTLRATESLMDPSLDCTGNPLTMEEEIFGDIHNKRALAPITSPWSGRIIKPIIRQDFQSPCKKLLLFREIISHFHKDIPGYISPPPSPIEYRYLRPHMLPQVNNLLRETFWPDVDISESILYPEFSVVALFKDLVIGCAFISTLGYITYICVHPEWRSAGIAKFMLYHLIQTSPGKDITLHVSTTNPAIHLYHRFCFLIDETIPNFFAKYLPPTSPLSRDAFFMRLKR